MRRALASAKRLSALSTFHAALLFLFACATTPSVVVPPPAPPPLAQATEAVLGTARVVSNTLNVRSAPSLDGEILTQVKKGEHLTILQSGDDWLRIRLGDGTVGWVSRALIAIDGEKIAKSTKPRRSGCPADADFHFAKTPTPAFSDSAKHGLVVVDAYVNVKGDVVSTKVVSNTTGDDALAFLAQREMKESKFVVPIRNCTAREFIFTYRRSF